MNIGFEAKRLFTNRTGLGNYSRFVVNALSLHHPANNYLLYTPKGLPHKDAKNIVGRPNVEVITPGGVYSLTFGTSIWRTWGMSQHASIANLDIFHGLSHELPMGLPRRIKTVVTVHDLIFFRYPEFYNPIDVLIYKFKLVRACRMADKIIAVSSQTANDLIDFVQVDPLKVEIIGQGCHANFKRRFSAAELSQVKVKYKLPSNYILNVGTIERRKNLLVMVRALSGFSKESRVPLVVIGKKTEYFKEVVEEARSLNVLHSIQFLENVPFEDFPGIYQGADVFVYPSLFEGFGIPLLEAIECQVPVIASQGSCFKEVAGPSSIYVDPMDAEELKSQLCAVLENSDLSSKMITDSTAYVRKFQPDVISANLISVYEAL